MAKSMELVMTYLNDINPDLINNTNIIKSENFMDINYHLSNVKIIPKLIEENKFEKKFKYLLTLINLGHPVVICGENSSVVLIEEQLKKRKIRFNKIEECKIKF